jgi:sulfonate transport system substrate-binding protein
LLRVLAENNLTEKDINTVLLQHPDGYTALVCNQVDAWAGLDPHMARAELESGAVLFHRNVDLNTYGILNVRTAFAEENPELVKRVLGIYEKARHYALENPEELRDALVEAAGISADVAARQLERTDITKAAIGDEHRALLIETGKVLQNIGIIKPEVNVTAVADQLIDRQFNH